MDDDDVLPFNTGRGGTVGCSLGYHTYWRTFSFFSVSTLSNQLQGTSCLFSLTHTRVSNMTSPSSMVPLLVAHL